jgi:hypothetical protein
MTVPTPAAHGDSHGGSGAVGKAIFAGFVALILLNGNMPANTQFALIIGIIAYFVVTKGSKGGSAPSAGH